MAIADMLRSCQVNNFATSAPYQSLHHEECHQIIVDAHHRGIHSFHPPVEENDGDAMSHHLII